MRSASLSRPVACRCPANAGTNDCERGQGQKNKTCPYTAPGILEIENAPAGVTNPVPLGVTPPPEVLASDLGAGETQVITPALRHGARRVVLDDLEGRRCAKAMGLRVIGTPGVVGRAKAMEQIALAAPVIEHLRRTGLYVSDALVQHILLQVCE